jgi:Peptidase A4 family
MRRMTIALAIGWLAIPVALASTSAGVATIGHAVFHPGAILTRGAFLQSSNWSGVADTGGTYTSVKGSWRVPAVSATSGPGFASDWVGVGGFFAGDSTLIQAGTSEQMMNGQATYNAWTEILPQAEVPITRFTVHPGDAMTVTIKKGAGKKGAGKKWTIIVNDATSGKTFTKHLSYASSLRSAEWIHEAPTVGGTQATLASTTPAVFDPGFVNGSTVIGSGGTLNRIQLIGLIDATPSNLDSDNNGFQVADGLAVPPPPST